VPALSKILSRRDLDFLLYEWLDVEALTGRKRFAEHSRETFDAFLDLSERMAERDFAPHNRKGDLQEPTFDGVRAEVIPEVGAALRVFNESGLLSAPMDAEVGGLQLPLVVARACFLWLQAANIATSSYSMLTMGNASLLIEHGTAEQVERFARPMLEGRFTGTMCLSEPQAGSSLTEVATRAVPAGDGSWRVTGGKMWISGGDHELSETIVHLVLARTAGVKGLSLFIVPKHLVGEDGSVGGRNGVTLAGLNHKMGYRGTTNAVLAFEDAVGYLVGEEGGGLGYMFHMMNEARIGVGSGAVALGYTGYLHALAYARERVQGGRPQVPIVKHPDVRRMLLASKSYVEGGLALVLYAAKLQDEPSEENAVLLDLLTPIVKAWPSQWCRLADDHAIQVHGGYGYTREYPVEQFYRDNRLNSIHEGTDGIQALDLAGRKLRQHGGAGFAEFLTRVRAAARAVPADLGGPVLAACDRVERTATADPAVLLTNATAFLDAAGHLTIAWLWLAQLAAAGDKPGDFYDGKRLAARYFVTHELPRIGPMLDLIDSGDTLLADLDDAALG
jgi:butyryl-CoA dehydrogenase